MSATNAPASPEEQRLQELLQLQYDRRPQELLQTLGRQLDASVSQTNEVLRFRDDVVAGRWPAVGEFIGKLPEKQRAQVYQSVLSGLQKGAAPGGPGQMQMPPGMAGAIQFQPGMMPGMMPGMPPGMMPGPVILPADVLALAEIAPGELTEAFLQSLGQLLSRALTKGNSIEPFVVSLEKGTGRLGGQEPARRAAAVKLLVAAGRLSDAGKFLPLPESVKSNSDLEGLDLHARYNLEVGRQRKVAAALQTSWELTQTILMATNAPVTTTTNQPTLRQQALLRALELLPLIASQEGTNWLRSCFREQPARGMAILSAATAPPQDFRTAETRQRSLAQQNQAVTALLAVAAEDEMSKWTTPLTIMAMNWAQEAELSRTRWMDRPRFNPNYGYYDPEEQMRMQQMNDPNQPQPIAPGELLRMTPDTRWLMFVDPSVVPQIGYLVGALQVKADEPLKGLQAVTNLANAYPARATQLANELLGGWAKVRNPSQNSDSMRMRYGPYGPIYYGMGSPYGMGGQGISLTRAMQNRNLVELAELLASLRQANLKDLDREGVVRAFTAAHSQAEVFRVEDIEQVFGKVESMETETLAGLLQTMRARLATTWRNMQVQQDAKTKRTDKDITAEVTRGYEVLTELLQQGLSRWPDSWRLHLVQATAWFDFAEFQYGKKVDLPIYVEKRERSFAEFQKASELYGAELSKMEPSKYTAEVFVGWFNANLGASDLAYVTRQQEPSMNNLARIRDTILSLPASTGPRHLELFCASVNESLNSIKGELKPRYTRAALRVAGDLPAATEIQKLARYYDDLLGEIGLEVRLDGDAIVGHTAPFGVFIALRHSAQVERESGGFGRYLQSQNQPYYGMMNSGQRNAREDFEKQLREKLSDTFDIRAITFADDKVQSRGCGRPGWRETPLAYVLLKAKDGAVDRLPSFHFDLDFQDQRGQVVLPVESSIVLLDARPDRAPARPVTKVAITQILDDREAAAGKLTLDIRATGRGLVPELKELLEVGLPGFVTAKTNDSGVNLTKLDTESDNLAALTERSWVFNLEPVGRGKPPAVFRFPETRSKDFDISYKRYADADLVQVKPEVALAGLRLRPDLTWVWVLSFLVVAGGGALFILRRRQITHPAVTAEVPYTLPDPVTPFAALKLLRRIEADPNVGLRDSRRGELVQTIRDLERGYFAPPSNGSPNGDLTSLLQSWLPKQRDLPMSSASTGSQS